MHAAVALAFAFVAQTASSTTALKELIDELAHVESVLTASTSSIARLSEEGLELHRDLDTSTTTIDRALTSTTPATDAAKLTLVYTGAGYGLGADHYAFELPQRLQEALGARGSIVKVEAMHGVLVQGYSI